jgi:hypothetical protein
MALQQTKHAIPAKPVRGQVLLEAWRKMQASVSGNSPRAAPVTRPIAAAANVGVVGLSRARSGQLPASCPAPASMETWLPALNSQASPARGAMGAAASGGASVLSSLGLANPATRIGSGELAAPAEQLIADRVRALQPSLRPEAAAAAAAAIQVKAFSPPPVCICTSLRHLYCFVIMNLISSVVSSAKRPLFSLDTCRRSCVFKACSVPTATS